MSRQLRIPDPGFDNDNWWAVLEHISDLVAIIDKNHCVKYVNTSFANSVVMSVSEICGIKVTNLVEGPDCQHMVGKRLNLAFAGFSYSYHTWIKLTGIGERYMHTRYIPCPQANGSVDSVLIVANDLTDILMSQRELAISEARFQSLLTSKLVGFLSCSSDGDITTVNETFCKMLGFELPELLKRNIFEFIHPDDYGLSEEFIKARFEDLYNISEPLTKRLLRRDGEIIYCSFTSSVTQGVNGENHSLNALVTDVTQEYLAKEKLAQSEKHYRSLFEASQEAMMLANPQGRLIDCNTAAVRMLGFRTREELLTQTLEQRSAAYQPSGLKAIDLPGYMLAEIDRKGTAEFKWHYLRPDQSNFLARVRIGQIHSRLSDDVCYLALVRDVSSEEKTLALLQHTQEKLELAQQVAACGSYEYRYSDQSMSWTYELYRILELDPQENEALTANYIGRIHPDDLEYVRPYFRKSLDQGISYDLTYRLLMPDKRVKYVDERCQIFRDKSGQALRALGIVHDVSSKELARITATQQLEMQTFIADLGRFVLQQSDQDVLNEVMQKAVEGLARVLSVEFTKVLELQAESNLLLLRWGIGWDPGTVGYTLLDNDNNSQAGYTLQNKDPVIVYNLQEETRFKTPTLLTNHAVNSGISVIIGSPEAPYGVLGIHSSTSRDWSEAQVSFVQTVANILAEVTARAKLNLQIIKSRNKLRRLAARLTAIREEERSQIARLLHDDLSQSLTALRFNLVSLKKKLSNPEEVLRLTNTSIRLTESILSSINNLSHNLHPHVLHNLGLQTAMQGYLSEISARTGIPSTLGFDAGEINIQGNWKLAIYRIFQEAVTNVVRHANANNIEVSLRLDPHQLLMIIRDDGIGINPEEMNKANCVGIISMNERAGEFGGHVIIENDSGGGTLVTLTSPSQADRPAHV